MVTKLALMIPLILCLTSLSGQDLKASNSDFTQDILDRTYRPVKLKLSDNGRWAAFFKLYMTNQDTLVLVDTDTKIASNLIKPNIMSFEFDSDNNVLLKGNSIVELINLKNPQNTKQFKNVIKGIILKQKPLIILLCIEDSIKKLQIRDKNGILLNEIKGVYDYFVTADENFYFVVESKNTYALKKFEKSNISTLYTTKNKITNVLSDPNTLHLLLTTKNESNTEEYLYFNSQTKKTHTLNSLLEFVPQWTIIKKIPESNSFFLRTWKSDNTNNNVVDIWLGNDYNLKKKFQNNVVEKDFVWHPIEEKLTELAYEGGSQAVPLGNPNHFLVFNPTELEDYTKEKPLLNLHLYNLSLKKTEPIDTLAPQIYVSTYGNYLLSEVNDTWNIYNLKNKTKTIIDEVNIHKPYFCKDDSFILFAGYGGLWRYDLKTSSLSEVLSLKGYRTEILNFKSELLLDGYNFYKNVLNSTDTVFLKLTNLENNKNSIIQYSNGKTEVISPLSEEFISSFFSDAKRENLIYWKENFNQPPSLYFKSKDTNERKIFQTNPNDSLVHNLIQKEFHYTDSEQNKLKAILFYPINFDPAKTYPLVVHVYKKQSHLKNHYLDFDYSSGVGFHIRSLLEKGYFVYLPDLVIKDKGPGLSAIEDLNNAMNALTEKAVDKKNSALIGHSFGGFITNFAATHSNFKTYISGAGKSDLVHSFHTFSYDFLFPESARIESHFYNMKVPFSLDKEKYFKNNPINYVDSVKAPILLWTGEKDRNIPSSETMGFYLALKRNKKKTIALFYSNEKHYLKNFNAQKDLLTRVLDWFDFHLKNESDIKWILEEFKEDALSL